MFCSRTNGDAAQTIVAKSLARRLVEILRSSNQNRLSEGWDVWNSVVSFFAPIEIAYAIGLTREKDN